VQAQADIVTNERKTAAEIAANEREAQLKERLMLLDHALKEKAQEAKLQMEREQHHHAVTQTQMGMIAGAQTHDAKMEQMKSKAKPSE